MEITSKKQQHEAIYNRFRELKDTGLTVTAATMQVMSEYNICSPSTVNNIRKKYEEDYGA